MSQFCRPALASPTFVSPRHHVGEEGVLTGVSSPATTPSSCSDVEFCLGGVEGEDTYEGVLAEPSDGELDDVQLPSATAPRPPHRRPATVPPLDLSTVAMAVGSSEDGAEPDTLVFEGPLIPSAAPHRVPPAAASLDRAKNEIDRLKAVIEELQETNAALQRRVEQAECRCTEAQQIALQATAEVLKLQQQVQRDEQSGGGGGGTSIMAGTDSGRSRGGVLGEEGCGDGVAGEGSFESGISAAGHKGGVQGVEAVGRVAREEEEEGNARDRRGRRWCIRAAVLGAIGFSAHVVRRIALH